MLTPLNCRRILVLAGLSLTFPLITRAADAPKRPPAQIIADIKTADAAIPEYGLDGRLDFQYHEQMAKEVAPSLRHLVDLYAELENASPAEALKIRGDHCLFLAELALDSDPNALSTLTRYSQSAKPADALFGTTGLIAYKWWRRPDLASQKNIVPQFENLAKANPKEDLLVGIGLTMARYHCASDDTANALRDVIEHDLHGPAAIKYQHQPNKLGRPFKLTVPILGGKPLSLSAWKGKVILIDFWATWCPPCRASLPGLAKLYQENHDKGFEVLGVSNDYDIADLKQFLAQNKDIVWPQSFNPAGPNRWHNLAVTLGIDAIPTSYLIDRDGILRNIQIGIPEEKIKRLLDQPAKPDSPTDTSAKK